LEVFDVEEDPLDLRTLVTTVGAATWMTGGLIPQKIFTNLGCCFLIEAQIGLLRMNRRKMRRPLHIFSPPITLNVIWKCKLNWKLSLFKE
jgi:hypothetical protein